LDDLERRNSPNRRVISPNSARVKDNVEAAGSCLVHRRKDWNAGPENEGPQHHRNRIGNGGQVFSG